jgi:hypothetical protein
MRKVAWLFIVVGTWCVPSTVRSADSTPAQERAVLEKALRLAGPQSYAQFSFVLTSELLPTVSRDAEAWTVYDEHGMGNRIFVYTRSRVFRCASVSHRDQGQCLLKVASIIVHEAWHLRNGPDEVGAYEAQIIFLKLNEASAFLQSNEAAAMNIREVRLARDRVLADSRKRQQRVRELQSRDEHLETRIVPDAVKRRLDVGPRYVTGVLVERFGEPLEAQVLVP